MIPNRHQRRAMSAVSRKRGTLPRSAATCVYAGCGEPGSVAVVRDGEMRGALCALHDEEHERTVAAPAREAAMAKALASLPLWRRLRVRLALWLLSVVAFFRNLGPSRARLGPPPSRVEPARPFSDRSV